MSHAKVPMAAFVSVAMVDVVVTAVATVKVVTVVVVVVKVVTVVVAVVVVADVVTANALVGHAQCRSPVFDKQGRTKLHAGSEQVKNVPSLHCCPPSGGTYGFG